MKQVILDKLRENQDKIVKIFSTEGEIVFARVIHISEEKEDVIIDILSTNQPERYQKMGSSNYKECVWALPFAFIAKIESCKQE